VGVVKSGVRYYPAKGAGMKLSLQELCLAAIAVAAWVYVLFGANLL
jgi:hypothetical protein